MTQNRRHAARSLNPALPARVDDWLNRALARAPEHRFDDAMAAAEAFVALLPAAGAMAMPRRPPPPPRPSPAANALAYRTTVHAPSIAKPMAGPVPAAATGLAATASPATLAPSRAPWVIAVASLGLSLAAVTGVAWWALGDDPMSEGAPVDDAPLPQLDDRLMFTRASEVAEELVDEAGSDAKRTTRLMFTPAVGQLITKRDDAMRIYTRRFDSVNVTTASPNDAPTFDATTIDMSVAQVVVGKAEKQKNDKSSSCCCNPAGTSCAGRRSARALPCGACTWAPTRSGSATTKKVASSTSTEHCGRTA